MPETGFWRTEIWHPIFVHFPIVLLLVATFMQSVSFFLIPGKKESWQNTASWMLYAGCIAAWISIYTGNMADGIVARKICDPTILKRHELASYRLAYLFSAAAILHIALLFRLWNENLKRIFSYIIIVLMLTGSGYLVYSSHLGASLVYQQGAGVIKPPDDCE